MANKQSRIIPIFALDKNQIRTVLERFLAGENFPQLRDEYGFDSAGFLKLLRLHRIKADEGGCYVDKGPVTEGIKVTVHQAICQYGKHVDAELEKDRIRSFIPLLEPSKVTEESPVPLKVQKYKEPVGLKLKNAERDQRIIAGYNMGKTHGELGAEFGMNPQSIGLILRKNGIGKPIKSIVKPTKPANPTPLQIALQLAAARRAERKKEAAERKKERVRQEKIVFNKAKALALKLAPKIIPSVPENPRTAEMISAYKAGSTYRQIAEFFGVSRSRVGQILNKYGITYSDRKMPEKTADRKKREAAERKSENNEKLWGCTGDAYLALVEKHGPLTGNSNMAKYLKQRHNAHIGHQSWYFTFETWLGMLERYGHWDENGLANGVFKIIRIHDHATPYSPQTCCVEPANLRAPTKGLFLNYVINDPNTHFDKLNLTKEEYCQHIAEYGDHNDVDSPINKYLNDEISQENPTCSFILTFKEWWDIWGSSCKPINHIT
jgi:hypothetical protein